MSIQGLCQTDGQWCNFDHNVLKQKPFLRRSLGLPDSYGRQCISQGPWKQTGPVARGEWCVRGAVWPHRAPFLGKGTTHALFWSLGGPGNHT